MIEINCFINSNKYILNVEKHFIRYVHSGNYIICETIKNIETNIKPLYLYTGNIEWLKLSDYTSYNIEYRNKIYNVWFCEKVSLKYILENTDLNKNISKEIIKELEEINTNIKKCNFINARCIKSMEKLDDIHRNYIKKDIFKKNEIVAIKSVAGSGKTTTLLNLAKQHNKKKILYLAFNKSLIEEIRNKLKKQNITNLYPVTFDSLMRKAFIKKNEEPNLIDLKPANLGDIIEWFNKKPYRVKNAYVSKFNKFCNQMTYNNIEDYCKKELKKEDNLLIKLWKKTITKEFQTFNSIRKHVEINNLCKDYIDNIYDLIFIDEAQDFDNLMLKILLEDTTIPKLFVGDPKQAIYEWRGCINAFDKLPKNTLFIEFYSTFRIGNPACEEIRQKFNNCWMISKSPNNTILEYDKNPKERYVYLFRTWKNLLLTAEKTENIWIYNYDKQKNIIQKLHDTLQKYKLSEEDKSSFEDDLPAFLLQMTQIELQTLLDNIDNNITTMEKSICNMYTIHSYKGLEDDIIKIYNDIDIKNEENLYYVALTRGKKNIILDSLEKTRQQENISVLTENNPKIDTIKNNNINYIIKTECKHDIIVTDVKKMGGPKEGHLLITITGPSILNKTKKKRLFALSIEESINKISEFLKIENNTLTIINNSN
tara:strand:+ start:2203 stop:4161 length:1959 start_codon:yes stop_codon:yes gene_type:complete